MPIELEKFRKELIYEETAPITVITTDLDDLSALDKLAELKQQKYGSTALYYFLGLLTLSVLTFIVFSFGIEKAFINIAVVVLITGCIGLGIAWIYYLNMSNKYKKLNLSNYRYDLTKSLLQMLARDMDETASIYVRLSFKKTERDDNKNNTIPHPYKFGFKIDIYENEWLKIKGSFLDKTRFFLNTNEVCKKQYGYKRSRSGKSKYKSKVKSYGLEVNLSLTYPQRRYGAVKGLKNDVIKAIKLPAASTLRRIKVTDKVIYLLVRIPPEFAENKEKVYQTITSMFLSVYQVLNLAKMLSK
ncbi:hypothetical protein [Anabaena sp. 4-3]|uniref:hypothetical protein n=1 Tax=Anabaena sp. 4-3 TaxID=1811979 RepID=UPI000837493A|nr:hypothetical protein [Anabaena sp. 4-3]